MSMHSSSHFDGIAFGQDVGADAATNPLLELGFCMHLQPRTRNSSLVLVIMGFATAANAQLCTIPESGSFAANAPSAGAQFGSGLKLSSGHALVAAEGEQAAYVFDGAGDIWQQAARLTPNDAPVSGFATDVDIEGNRAVVGTNSGRAYVFEMLQGSWQQTASFGASNFNPLAGRVVSLAGEHIAITYGAYPSSTVFIFTKFGSGWFETNQLHNVPVVSMDMDGDRIAFGSNGLRVYKKTGAQWQLEFDYPSAGLGEDLRIKGNRIVVTSNWPQGAFAYVFELKNGSWSLAWKVPMSYPGNVDFEGDRIVTSGVALTEVFDLLDGVWIAGYRTNKFGAVAISGDVALIGDRWSDNGSMFDVGRVAFGKTGIPILSYGSGCAGTGGFVPKLTSTGCPVAGSTLTCSITQGLAGSTALLLIGLNEANTPLKFTGCSLLVSGLISPQLTVPLLGTGPGQGEIHISMGIPPGTANGSITTQALVLDPATSLGVVSTNGVRLTFE